MNKGKLINIYIGKRLNTRKLVFALPLKKALNKLSKKDIKLLLATEGLI